MQMEIPRKVVIKSMTVINRNPEQVFAFFADVKKSMEVGEAAKSVTKQADGWWTFDHVVAGRAKMKHTSAIEDAGVLNHGAAQERRLGGIVLSCGCDKWQNSRFTLHSLRD